MEDIVHLLAYTNWNCNRRIKDMGAEPRIQEMFYFRSNCTATCLMNGFTCAERFKHVIFRLRYNLKASISQRTRAYCSDYTDDPFSLRNPNILRVHWAKRPKLNQ